MLNFKTFIKTVYRNTNNELCKDIAEGVNRSGIRYREYLEKVIETFRVYYKGDEELFVVILPVFALDNDGVVFRK